MTRQQVLTEAARCVLADREEQYGAPEDNFGRIAKYWGIYLGREITPSDVASMMILLKVSRAGHASKDDTWVDIAGYAACAGELMEV